jgi:hypothetical protein
LLEVTVAPKPNAVAFVKLGEPTSALFPIAVFSLPVVFELRDSSPIAVLLLPVVVKKSEACPIAVLLMPVAFFNERLPYAVLKLPAVFEFSEATP